MLTLMKITPSMIVLTLVIVSLAGVLSKKDYCQSISGSFNSGSPVMFSEALACFKSFKYDSARAKAITDTLYKTFDLHVYKDISKNSPTSEFPLQVDVLKGIKKIASTQYKNDYDFNKALFLLINSLNDGNAFYYPNCYSNYVAVQTAFPLVSLYRKGAQTIQVSSKIAAFAGEVQSKSEKIMGVNITSYAGATVTRINGKRAVDYAIKFADKQGVFKDINARYNFLFSRPYLTYTGFFYGGLTSMDTFLAPESDNITLTVRKAGYKSTEKLVVPLLANSYGFSKFNNSSDYWAQYCAAVPSSAVRTTGSQPLRKGIITPSRDIHFNVENTALRKQSSRVLVDSFVSTYLLEGSKTGVMVIPNFAGQDQNDASWQADVYNGISQLLSYGGEKLIIDVLDNPGRSVQLATALLKFLFPATEDALYPTQNPATPFIQRMVRKSNKLMDITENVFTNPSQFNWFTKEYNTSTGYQIFTKSDEYFFPLVNLTFGGTVGSYSSLYNFPDVSPPYGTNLLKLPAAQTKPFFPASKVVILSNGVCYNACARFTYAAQELVGVKIVAVGGIGRRAMTYAAGNAGYAYSLDDLIDYDINYLLLASDKDAPKKLPIQASVGYTAAQSYCRESDTIPADFVYKKADYRISFSSSTVNDPFGIYGEVVRLF